MRSMAATMHHVQSRRDANRVMGRQTRNPRVEEEGEQMHVTGVSSTLVDPGSGKNWLFVPVDTDAGISGWGECYTQADRDQAIAAHVQQLGRYLVGRDPRHIK